MEGGAVGWLGGWRPRRVLGRDRESGPIMGGDRELDGKPPPAGQGMPSSRAGVPPTVMAWSVCGLPGTDVRRRRPGGSFWRRPPDSASPVLRSPVPRPLQEVNDAVLVARGHPFPCHCRVACPPGRVCGQGLAMAVVPDCGPGSSDWLAQGPGPGTASVAGVVVRVRGRRTGRFSVGRWVSFVCH
jgi:hypothetical protein